MQFIEVSLTGVRSAVITLSAPGQPQRVVLFPMLHLATPDFYTSVAARLGSCRRIVLGRGRRDRCVKQEERREEGRTVTIMCE